MLTITPYDADGNAITELYQWDSGITVYLESDYITEAMQVHFSNTKRGTAYVVSGTYSSGQLSATIPATVLEDGRDIYGYVFASTSDGGQTILAFSINVIRRAKPSDYADTDTDDYISTTSALAKIEELLAEAKSAASAAATSESNAADSAELAESWAVGGTGTRDGEDTDNAKYYAEIAGSNAASDLGFYWATDGYLWCTED